MVDTNSSLFQRIQARFKNNNNLNQEIVENESESDVDDDVTLDECVKIVERKSLDGSFTNILERSNVSVVGGAKISLREAVSKKRQQQHTVHSEGSLQSEEKHSTKDNATKTLPEIHAEDQGTCDPVHINEELPCVSFKKKRARLTEEESNQAKLKKEEEKRQRQQKKEEEKLERELKKQKEKAMKKVNMLNNRDEGKNDCMEKMLVVIDPGLVEGAQGADLLKCLQDVSVTYEIKSLPISCCMGWMRENSTFSVNEKTEVIKQVNYNEEQHILHVVTANELAVRVNAEIQGESEEETLTTLVKELKESFPGKKITLLFTGLNTYYRLFKTNQNRHFRNQALNIKVTDDPKNTKKRRKKTFEVPVLQKTDVEQLLVQVQTVTDDIFIRKCDDEKNVGDFVASFTKSIAEAPYKKVTDASLQFYGNAANDKQSIKVFDDGRGIHQLWNQQLQQFFGVRHETSVAITQRYPTPTSLIQMYANQSPEDGARLLQDIEIRRGVGVLQTNRRVGPELSRRVYKLLTSTNGEELLAK